MATEKSTALVPSKKKAARSCVTELSDPVTKERAVLALSAAQQVQVCAAEFLDAHAGYINDSGCVPRALIARMHSLAESIQVLLGEDNDYRCINAHAEVVNRG